MRDARDRSALIPPKSLPQGLENGRYADGSPLDQELVKRATDLGLKRLGAQGRLDIHPSCTGPVIRVWVRATMNASGTR